MQTFQVDSCLLHDLSFTADGRLLVGSPTRMLFDTLGSTPPRELKPPTGAFTAYAQLALDNRVLVYATPTDNPHIHVWDLTTDRIAVWADAGRDVRDLAVSPDGETLYAVYTDRRDYTGYTEIRVFDIATGELKGHIPPHEEVFAWVAMSADGTRLAGRGSWGVCVWDLVALKVVTVLKVGKIGDNVGAIALSADGSRLATITSRSLALRDISNGESVREVFRSGKHKRRATSVACSPTKPMLVSGDTTGQIFSWDHAGNVLTRYDWGLSEVQALCFAPDGLRCAAVDAKGKVVVWDVDA